MELSSNELKYLHNVAINAAQKAGKMIINITGQNIKVQKKTGGSSAASQVLTEVDLKSQKIILTALEPTLKEFDLALLTEEAEDDGSRLQKNYFWCVDPLDGTLPFTESKSGYAVSIALVSKDGAPQIGVVYDPVTKTLYSAQKGMDAKKNKQKWLPDNSSKIKKLTWIMDRSLKKNPNFPEYTRKMKDLALQSQLELTTISHGGAVMNALWTLENAPAIYFKPPIKRVGGGSLWDFAATALITKEASGICSDFLGNSLDLNRADSTFLGHGGVLYASNHHLYNKVKKIMSA